MQTEMNPPVGGVKSSLGTDEAFPIQLFSEKDTTEKIKSLQSKMVVDHVIDPNEEGGGHRVVVRHGGSAVGDVLALALIAGLFSEHPEIAIPVTIIAAILVIGIVCAAVYAEPVYYDFYDPYYYDVIYIV